ncbi:hypothetical protein [Corallococcus terminator]|uniref:Uncharacterized protein n=1 Tax=Corallococcus terminator TaxID=2316733 RepID=A0A3A8JQL8_9BACT|nr:hypothetical protein [Corallococcus terminator]RKG91943.1 hypothetical protein D7V88_08100 [Corallococcus terminator]
MDARRLLTLPLLALLACGDSSPEEDASASCEPEARGAHDPERSGPLDGAQGPRAGTPTLVWTEGSDLPLVGTASFQHVLRHGSFDRKASWRVIAPAW